MKKTIINTKEKRPVAILVGASFESKEIIEENLEELAGLADTAGIEVVGTMIQSLHETTAATYIGSGKTEELHELVKNNNADMVIFDEELIGSQINNLEEILEVKVLDRSILILDIFAGRAKSTEGKLQVELAQLKYNLPRINALSGSSGRFGGGGIGMRGPGETKLEMNKRIIKDKIVFLQKQIKKLGEQRQLLRTKRQKAGEKTVAIVGYTNVGKSTLLNKLVKADVYADDKLFATLDTTTRKLFIDYGKQILFTDTVGFINKLPHGFIEAFKATLEEALSADLILQIVDCSDKHFEKHMAVTSEVLQSIGAGNIPMMIVYNKIDNCNQKERLNPNILQISAKKGTGIDELKQTISSKLFN